MKTTYRDELPEELLLLEDDDDNDDDDDEEVVHLQQNGFLDGVEEGDDDDVTLEEEDLVDGEGRELRPLKKRKVSVVASTTRYRAPTIVTSRATKSSSSPSKRRPRKVASKNNNSTALESSKLSRLQERLKIFNLQERLKGYRRQRLNANQLIETLLNINNLLLGRVFTDQRPPSERANQELSLASLPLGSLPQEDRITVELTPLVERYRSLVEKKAR